MKLLHAAMAKSEEMGVPQCISIVDRAAPARLRAWTGRSPNRSTPRDEAMTAASYGVPTGDIAAAATSISSRRHAGKTYQSAGGLPIIVDGHVIGGIGVGSAPARRTAGGERALAHHRRTEIYVAGPITSSTRAALGEGGATS